MGDIYSAAHSVCAWLGPQTDDTDWSVWGSWWSWRTGLVFLPSAETAKNNGFWNRMWVVQEIKSAKRLAFACGSRLATAEQFKTTIGKDHSECSWVFDNSLAKRRTSLLDWIMRFHDFECFDARDKIFAIQNLVPESQRIEVDYRLSFRELYLLVLDRQFGDMREMMFEEIKLLHVFLAAFVINILGVTSMNPGQKYLRMAADRVSHVEAKVESVVMHIHLFHGGTELTSTWPSQEPYDYAFSYPHRRLGSALDDYLMPPTLQDVPKIRRSWQVSLSGAGQYLLEAYTTMGPSVKTGLATPGVQRGDLLCSIQGFNRVLAFVRPFVYVPEDLAYGPLSKTESRWIKPPLRAREKLLFVPVVPEGKTQEKKMWLSYQVIGLAIHTNEEYVSNPPLRAPSSADRPSNQRVLYKQLNGMPLSLYLSEERVDALSNFAYAYDHPTLPIKPLNIDHLHLVEDQDEFFIQDPTDPTGQRQLSSNFFNDPKNIIMKTVELAIAKQAQERSDQET